MLENKHILITGANRGIGKATAELCVACGANVYLAGRDEEALDRLAEALGDSAVAFCYELTDTEQAKQAFSHIQQHIGKLDGLVNNAGIMHDAPLAMTSLDVLQQHYEVNVRTSFQHAQLASRLMTRQRSGSIVNLCSLVGERGSAGQSAYAASKSALSGMTRSIAKELGPLGIRANGVAPGFIDTDLTSHYYAEQRDKVIAGIPLGRPGTPHEVANVIVFLLSDHTSYISGQIIGIDGGMTL